MPNDVITINYFLYFLSDSSGYFGMVLQRSLAVNAKMIRRY